MLQESRTDHCVPPARFAADRERIFEVLQNGSIALIPLDVAYALIGAKSGAIAKIFAAKQRSYDKPSGMFGNLSLSRELHILPSEKREIARVLVDNHDLPFSIVAAYRPDHPLLHAVEPFVLNNSTKNGTLDMLINAGALHNEIARLSAERGLAVFGSSANRSLTGSKYRLQDVEPSVRAAADLAIDYGTSKYANLEGLSSTIIDFRDFHVVRRGVCFERISGILAQEFGIALR
jgi:tRNA A37 threonylcarbamoyladenosine synthetase subunit TsaC/SUA5/YrdC